MYQLIEALKLEAERASRVGDYAKVAEIQYGKLREKEEELQKVELEMQNNLNELIKEEVTAENISEVMVDAKVSSKVFDILTEYVAFHSEIYLGSLDYLKKMKKNIV